MHGRSNSLSKRRSLRSPGVGVAHKSPRVTRWMQHQARGESSRAWAEWRSEIRSRKPKAQSRSPEPEPRAESREPRAQSPEPRAQSPEPRAQSREPRAESPEPRAQSPE